MPKGLGMKKTRLYWNTLAAAARVPDYVKRWFWYPGCRLVADLGVSLPEEYVEVVRRRLGLDDEYGPIFLRGSWWNGSYHDPSVVPHPVLVIFYSHRKRIKHPFSRAKRIAREVYEVYKEFRRAQWEAANARFNKYEGD